MKALTLILMTAGLLTIQSCSDKSDSADTQAQPQVSLAGNVYGLRDASDTAACGPVLPANDHFPELLFLDDSSFIKIVPVSCGDIGKDFTCSRHYSGTYTLDEKGLTLTFNPKMAVHYLKSKSNLKGDSLLLSSHVESEKSDMSVETLIRFNCKRIPYFEPCDVTGHFMVPASDTLAARIHYLKSETIWDSLFGRK